MSDQPEKKVAAVAAVAAPATKISFAAVPGAGSSAPVEKTPEANATVVGNPDTRVAAPPTRTITTFSGGDEEDGDNDLTDVRLPRLNIIQGLSGPELKKVGPDGTLVLKKSIALPASVRIVVGGCSKVKYIEKPVKFGDPVRSFDTLERVIQAGGTDQWRLSRDNKDKEGIPLHRSPWFMRTVTALLLIQKPTLAEFATVAAAGKPGELTSDKYAALEEHFSSVSADGIAFAACAYTVKSTSFGGFYVPIKTEQVSGVLRHGFYTRYITLKTKAVRAYEPVIEILNEVTSEPVRELARNLLR